MSKKLARIGAIIVGTATVIGVFISYLSYTQDRAVYQRQAQEKTTVALQEKDSVLQTSAPLPKQENNKLAQVGADVPTNTSSFTNTPPPTPSPSETYTPEPATLYKSDWSNGLNGWVGGSGWKIIKGQNMLLNDGTGKVLFAPIDLSSTPNYVIETELQPAQGQGCNLHFGILVRTALEEQPIPGYQIGWVNMFCSAPPGTLGISQNVNVDEPWNAQWNCYGSVTPDANWHKYRVEVNGNEIKLFYDSQFMCKVTDNKYLEGRAVGLWGKAPFDVRNFRVLALTP